MQTGFKLTLPNGDVFEATKDVQVTPEQDFQFLINGLSNVQAIYEQFIADDGGQSGRANGLGQQTFVGSGARIERIRVEFVQYEDSSDQWGSASSGDSARTKRDILNRALETQRIDSTTPATLEFGEYAESGQFAPKSVVILNSSLPFDAREQASGFRGSIEFADAADLESVVFGGERPE